MSNYRSEKGAALVLTMMIITLILLFILTLFVQVTNTTGQITTVEKNMTAGHLAEMGIDYYQALVEASIPKVITDTEELTLPVLKDGYGVMDEAGNYMFEIIDPHIENHSNGDMEIIFSSKGRAFDKEVVKKDITIPIKFQQNTE